MKRRVLLPINYRDSLRLYTLDPIYHSLLISKFVNYLISQGLKERIHTYVYTAFKELRIETYESGFTLLYESLYKYLPIINLRRLRKSRKIFQIGSPISPRKNRIILPVYWMGRLIKKSIWSHNIIEIIKKEFFKTSSKKGEIYLQKKRILKIARMNRAFTRLAWVTLYSTGKFILKK